MLETQGVHSPIVELVAVAVIIFAAVTIGIMTGLIPSSYSKNIPHEASTCPDCGVVESVRPVEVKNPDPGAGAVPGEQPRAAVAGALEADSGKILATVAGAASRAFTGDEIGNKNNVTATHYQIVVRMKDGSVRTITQRNDSGAHAGDSVKVVNGSVIRR